MHLQLLVLPAVLLNIATAGLIRSNRYPVRYVFQSPSMPDLTTGRLGIHARFQNSSSIPEATPQTSTFSTALTPSPIPFKAAQSESAVPASGQVGSVPAFGSGPGAATTEESHTSTSRLQPSTSSHRSVLRDTAAQSETTPAIQSSKPALQTIPASNVQQTSDFSDAGGSSTQTPVVGKSTATTSTSLSSAKTPLSNATAVAHTQQPVQSTSAKASAVNAGSQQSTATPTNAPAGDNGNIAMALGFNSIWATMDANSPCDANDKNQAVVCVSGQYAQCSGGKYILTACPKGQQCFALPLSKDFKGVTVQCASLQDANKQLGQTLSASASTATSTLSTSSKPEQPSVTKPSVTSTSSATSTSSTTVTSTAAGSAQATPSAQRPSVAQPSKTETVQTTVSHQTTFVGQQPTETTTESATQPKPTETTSATKASDSPTASPQITTSAQHSDSPSPSRTTTAAQTASDDPIIITPIPDSNSQDVQPEASSAKVAVAATPPVAASSIITPAPVLPSGVVTITETVTTTATTTVLGEH